MLGNLEGTPEEKLAQVAAIMAALAPQAACHLENDGSLIVCEAERINGVLHVEELAVELLPAELARHAAMRLGKATHRPESIGDWERWASAWHLLQSRGAEALTFANERIEKLRAEGALSGVVVWQDIRQRIAALQADPDAWPGKA